MTPTDSVIGVVEALDALAIPYMMVGSYVSNVWGVARSTQDADFVIEIDPSGIRRLAEALGTEYRLDTQMSFETVTSTHRFLLLPNARGFKIELFLVSDEPFDQERFRRRIRIPILGRPVCAATAEDMIVQKLRWSQLGRRRKDVDDVSNMIAIQRDSLDWDYVYKWCDLHGTRALLDELRSAALRKK